MALPRGPSRNMAWARATPGEHAGPHGSFPVASPHMARSAWNLAGHAEHPDVVRERIRTIAARKGYLDALPKTAHTWVARGAK